MNLSLLALASFLSINASAQEYLIPLENPSVHVYMAPGLAEVEPTAFLHFSISSCTKRQLRAEVARLGRGALSVKVIDLNGVDCMGPSIKRDYQLQISSEAAPHMITKIENPVAAVVHYSDR